MQFPGLYSLQSCHDPPWHASTTVNFMVGRSSVCQAIEREVKELIDIQFSRILNFLRFASFDWAEPKMVFVPRQKTPLE